MSGGGDLWARLDALRAAREGRRIAALFEADAERVGPLRETADELEAEAANLREEAEAAATAVLKQPELKITLDLNGGAGAASVLTCDFSLEYVRINADYRS